VLAGRNGGAWPLLDPGTRAASSRLYHNVSEPMEKLTWITVLICAALAACEPRGMPQKPKTEAARVAAVERSGDTTAPVAGERE